MTAAETIAWITARYHLDLGKGVAVEIPGITRDELPVLYRELGFREGAEIGVEQGKYAETMLMAHPTMRLHCVDAWKAYAGYRDHVTQSKLDGFFEATQQRLAAWDVVFHRRWSVEAAAQFADRSLDFVYIDANHDLLHVIQDLTAWVPKVRSGGIIAGHDFCRRKQSGYQVHVVEAVHAWTQAYHVTPWFVLGAKEIVDGIPRDRVRSYMWVQP